MKKFFKIISVIAFCAVIFGFIGCKGNVDPEPENSPYATLVKGNSWFNEKKAGVSKEKITKITF